MRRTATNTTARKLLLFYKDPLNKWLIVEAEKSVSKQYYPLLWHHIFLHIFYCGPVDPENKTAAPNQPLGSNDPKWDKLFNHMQALKARTIMLRYMRYQKYLVSTQKEKAA